MFVCNFPKGVKSCERAVSLREAYIFPRSTIKKWRFVAVVGEKRKLRPKAWDSNDGVNLPAGRLDLLQNIGKPDALESEQGNETYLFFVPFGESYEPWKGGNPHDALAQIEDFPLHRRGTVFVFDRLDIHSH